MKQAQKDVVCVECDFKHEIIIGLSKRKPEDKKTTKLARTAFKCVNCGFHNELELKKDLDIDFVW